VAKGNKFLVGLWQIIPSILGKLMHQAAILQRQKKVMDAMNEKMGRTGYLGY